VSVEDADTLQAMLERAKSWPVWGADPVGQTGTSTTASYAQVGSYGQSMRDLALWVALRESDRERIRSHLGWAADRAIRMDPLPERIAAAYSDLLYGESVEISASEADDQEQLDEMIEANELREELPRWVDECVSEGEIWWRVYIDRDASEYPIIEVNSRLDVVPLFRGRKIVAVAFLNDILTQEIRGEGQTRTEIWRHVEIQTDGLSRNLLYRGDNNSIGNEEPLSRLPETTDLPAEWDHGLKIMLAGRIPNKLGRDRQLGISEYHGVKDLLLDLIEAHTIMAENARNTAKARMVVPANAVGPDGKFDASQDVIVQESLDDALDDKKAGPYAILEYTFQADQLLKYMDNLVNVIMTRVGLAEQFVGGAKQSEGQAFTGTALRTRLIPTTLAANKKGRLWDRGVREMLLAAMQAASIPTESGGTGHTWKDKEKPPRIKRVSVLPEDQNEQTQRLVMAVQGEIMSIETAVAEEHPNWTKEEQEKEVERILEQHDAPDTGDQNPDQNQLDLPDQVNSEPGDSVPSPDLEGGQQPGAGRTPDGQSPAKRPPRVTAGGPR
jgi:hypothetical protein